MEDDEVVVVVVVVVVLVRRQSTDTRDCVGKGRDLLVLFISVFAVREENDMLLLLAWQRDEIDSGIDGVRPAWRRATDSVTDIVIVKIEARDKEG